MNRIHGKIVSLSLPVTFTDWDKQYAQYVIRKKNCFQNKSKFITEDYFVQHMNVTIKSSLIK